MSGPAEAASGAALERLLAAPAREHGVDLERLLAPLARYAALLLEWNARINLTGARDVETLAREHLADAFALVPHLPASGACVDVGSGAGLPGLVLALARPDLRFTLLEPLEKRRAFLAAAIRALGLTNVTVVRDRLEEHARANASAYDFAVARAVLALGDWLERGRALVRDGGVVAGLAGGGALELPPDAESHPYDVGAGPRAIVVVRK